MLSSTSLLRLWACSRLRLHGGAKPAIRQQCFSEPISVYALPTLPRHHARQDGGDAEHFSENPSAVFAKVSSSDFGEELVVFYHLSSKCISAFADGNTYGRFAGRGEVSYLYLREATFAQWPFRELISRGGNCTALTRVGSRRLIVGSWDGRGRLAERSSVRDEA